MAVTAAAGKVVLTSHRFVAALFVLACSRALAQQPTFRTGVEVTTVDVTVVDNDGRPIADVRSDEFRVRIDGQDRRVVRADWVPLTPPVGSPQQPPPPAGYSTNESTTRGRLLLIAVDQPNIRFAGTALLRSSLNAFIDRLQPADRIAAVALGQGGVSTTFTANREEVKRAIGRMTGDMRLPSEMSDFQIGAAEAVDIVDDNTAVLARAYGRECLKLSPGFSPVLPTVTSECLERLKSNAFVIATSVASEAQQTLSSLRALLDGLRKIDAPKTLVVVTEGFGAHDPAGIVELGSMAAAAQTSLYVLALDGSADAASNQGTPGPQAVVADRQMRSQGVALLASVAKGDVFNVIGTGGPAVARLEREVSGFYLVGVESTPTDTDGKAHPINVQVSRRGAIVRARRQLSSAAAARTRPSTPLEALTEVIKSPLMATSLTLRVTTASVRDADPTKIQVVMRADVGSGYSAVTPVTVAYLITDSTGAVVVNKVGDGRLSPKTGGGASPLAFTADASLAPGEYTLKLAVVEGARVGSVEHAIHTGSLDAAPPASATAAVAPRAATSTPAARVDVPVRPFRRETATTGEALRRFRESVPTDTRQTFDEGVAALTAGDYPTAEQRFRSGLQAGLAGDRSVALLVYLGATFAASGRDAEALGVWQVALTDGSAFPEIYEWLADTLVRVRDFGQARSIVREAVAQWPNDERFVSRLSELQPPQGGGR